MGKLKKAITLVELIIALTMVSVLMLGMFNIVAKKTKLALDLASGYMVCWKDSSNTLWQKTVYRDKKNGKETQEAHVVSSCTLKVPAIIKAGGKKFNAYLIGGGAAGARYSNIGWSQTSTVNCNQLTNTVEEIVSSCIQYGNNAESNIQIPFKDNQPMEYGDSTLEKIANNCKDMQTSKNIGCIDTINNNKDCYIKLSEKNTNKQLYYKVNASIDGCSDDKIYYHYPSTSNSIHECTNNISISNGFTSKNIPFILNSNKNGTPQICYNNNRDNAVCKDMLYYDASSGKFKTFDINDSKCTLRYYNSAKYSIIYKPLALASWVPYKSAQLNLNKDLTIPAANIGNSGSVSACQGGNTVFPEKENIIALGQKCDMSTSESGSISNITPALASKVSSSQTIDPKLPTLISDLNSNNLLGPYYNISGRYNNSYLDNTDSLVAIQADLVTTGSSKDNGYGLFGMQGGSSICGVETTYRNLTLGKNISYETGSNKYKCSYPGKGMGGAIVITWE